MNSNQDHNQIDSIVTKDNKPTLVKEIILWWERKRLIYNLLIIALSVFSIWQYWDYPMRSIIGGKQIIINAIVFIFGANLFYSLGWLLGIANHYLFKTEYTSREKKWILFVLGTLFSLVWTTFYFVVVFDVLFAD